MAHSTVPLLMMLFLCTLSSNSSFQPALVLEMAKILLENYCFPENLVGMQEAIQQAINSGEILQISDRKTLATVLTAGVQGALNDPRLTISYEPNFVPVMPPALSSLPKEQLIRLVKNSVKSDILENNVGYLRIDRIIGEETAVKFGSQLMESIWDKIAHTSSLIFDLRYSTAGELSGVPFIISYFSDPESLIHIDTVYDRPSNSTKELWTIPSIVGERYGKEKDVIILTSRHTTGAAEAVAYALKKLRRAITVGERSAGGSVKVQKIRIAQSKFYITVPVARSVSPITGQSWEVTGVSPNVHVIAKEAVAKAKSLLAIRNSIPKVVQRAGDLLEDHYAIHEVALKVSKVLVSKWADGLYRSVVDFESLASQLTADLQETSGDHRLHVFHCDVEPESLHELPKIPTAEEVGYIIDALFKIELLPGNIGYLRFDMMADIEVVKAIGPHLIKSVWSKIMNTDALIIDMRYNTGGYSTAIPLLCSYFFDAEPLHHLYSVFDRTTNTMTEVMTIPQVRGQRYGSSKELFILTSHMTGSAAEVFTRTMKDLNRATIVGEPTTGGSLSSRTHQIGDTVLYASIPNQAVFSAITGKMWSFSGVEPHIAVQANEALSVAQKILESRLLKRVQGKQ
ncbi:retinol-binding protein 3-like [Oreochromis aureus]|uniref:retinol-binding protein 3-like n=1 Tax=Oreochromis aureus TaxID=47969 RepID=UPI0019538025|nr:retinol-binding protein 3-like [Oreochromis aureus]